MKSKICLAAAYLLYTLYGVSSFAQSFILYGDKTYGGNKMEFGGSILYTGNDELIICGASATNVNGDKTDSICYLSATGTTDIWLLKIDTSLNILWNKDLGGDRADQNSVLIFTDTGSKMIFSARCNSDSACDKSDHNRGSLLSTDYWICMIDSNGNKLWDKTLGGTGEDDFPKIVKLTTGDFIVTGSSSSPISGDKTVANYGSNDYWTVKLDSLGNKLWDKVYGGSGNENTPDQLSVLACPGGAFIIGGSTESPVSGDVSDTSRGSSDYWIIKIDSAGNKLWDKRFGGSAVDWVCQIKATSDNGYILCGTTNSPQDGDVSDISRGLNDIWIVKTDSLGNKQWDNRYGGNHNDEATTIEPDSDGEYWITGYTSSDSSFEVSEPTYGGSDYWIFKIDSIGNKLWDKRFGGPGADYPKSFVIMPDSSIYLLGNADSGISAVKTDFGKGLYDYWLVHFKYTDGNVGINEISNQNNFVSVSPNPVQNVIYINSIANFTATQFTLYDAAQRKVMDKKFYKSASFSVVHLNAGIYFYTVKDIQDQTMHGKLVKQ